MTGLYIALSIIGILAIVTILFYFYAITPKKMDFEKATFLKNHNFAHRGLHTKDKSIPENSIAAFKNAVDHGYGMELDVRLTKDKQVVVFHDNDLKRMCGKEIKVSDLTYEELKKYRLAETEETIPLFTEVLSVVDGKTALIVEFKNEDAVGELEQKTYDILKNYHGEYCIESFNPFTVAWFKKNAPEVIRGQLASYFKKDKLANIKKFVLSRLLLNFIAKPQFIAYHYVDADRFFIRYCKNRGAALVAWTVREEKDHPKTAEQFDAIIFEFYMPSVTNDKQIEKTNV